MYRVEINLTPENIHDFCHNHKPDNSHIRIMLDFDLVVLRPSRVMANEYRAALYLGNPGDMSYIDRPVPAVVIGVEAFTEHHYQVWFLHHNHQGNLMVSQVSVTDGLAMTEIRSTDGRIITGDVPGHTIAVNSAHYFALTDMLAGSLPPKD